MSPIVVAFVVVSCIACSGCKTESSPPPPAAAVAESRVPEATIRAAEEASLRGSAERAECKGRVAIYAGSTEVDARTYVQWVARGDATIEEEIPDLDRVVSTAPRLDFTLDYPFEKAFTGSITGEITLRRIIDTVRSGFRHVYEGSTQRDIPRMQNKEVTGPYGRAFHVIGDLVIEGIDLCDGRWLEIAIGS